MLRWLHHLFSPHCETCYQEREREKECSTCETLRELLEAEKFEKKQLLQSILEVHKPQVETIQSTSNLESLKPRAIPWRVRQQMLEEEDRNRARVLADKQKEMKKVSTSELEKELDLEGENDAVSSS